MSESLEKQFERVRKEARENGTDIDFTPLDDKLKKLREESAENASRPKDSDLLSLDSEIDRLRKESANASSPPQLDEKLGVIAPDQPKDTVTKPYPNIDRKELPQGAHGPGSEEESDLSAGEREDLAKITVGIGGSVEEKTKVEREWEDITLDERKEKYGKSVELRERIRELHTARANVSVFEQRLGSRSLGHVLSYRKEARADRASGIPPRMPENVLKGPEIEYFKLLEGYEKKRAEYIGTKAWRLLKEQTRLAEERGEVHGKGLWERVCKGWRWLGDQNAEKLGGRLGWKPKGALGKISTRMFSLRTGVSVALLGASMYIPPLGLAAGMARQVMRGTGVAFTAQDLMRRLRGAKMEKLDITKVKDMSYAELEGRITDMEAFAAATGEQIGQNETYRMLRKELQDLIAPKDAEGKRRNLDEGNIPEMLQDLDDVLREKLNEEKKVASHQKMGAAGLGILSAAGLSVIAKGWGMAGEFTKHGEAGSGLDAGTAHKVRQALAAAREAHGSAEAIKAVRGTMTPDEWRAAMIGPVFSNEQCHAIIAEQAKLPESVMNAAEHGKAFDTHFELPKLGTHGAAMAHGSDFSKLTPFEEQARMRAPSSEFDAHLEMPKPSISGMNAAAEHAIEAVKTPETPGEVIGTIRRGGSAWTVAQEWLKTGKITKVQFNEAWSNSPVKLPSGQSIPLAELGLMHQGDQLVFHAAEGDIPAHFEVIDYAKDNLHIGSNEKLAEAFRAEGKTVPKALQDAIEAAKPHDGSTLDLDGTPHLTPEEVAYTNIQEVIHGQATPDAASLHETFVGEYGTFSGENVTEIVGFNEHPVTFEWGRTLFVIDKEGNIVHVLLHETLRPWEHARLVEKAADAVLKPEFRDVLREANTAALQEHHIEGPLADMANEFGNPFRLARAKDAALKLYEYGEALKAINSPDSPEARALTRAMQALRSREELLLGKIFK